MPVVFYQSRTRLWLYLLTKGWKDDSAMAELKVEWVFDFQQDALGAYTCASSWIKCESFLFYWVLTLYARLGSLSRCPVYQVLHQVVEDLDTNKKQTRGKPKLVPRFAAGTSNKPSLDFLLMNSKQFCLLRFATCLVCGSSTDFYWSHILVR